MLPRALLVLLLVMNLSVAAWWVLHDAAAPAPDAAPVTSGVPRLRLLSEPAGAPPTRAAVMRCHRFGPYADAAALDAARASARSLAGAAAVVTVPGPRPERWRVAAPPPADGDSAALATRIVAAGFDDTVIVAEGPEAGSIALGRFSTPEAAARHRDALQAAGIQAQVHAVGGDAHWLQLALPPGIDAGALRGTLGALQALELPCTR